MNEEILMILQICCNKFGVTEAQIKSANTNIEVANCRKAFAKIVKGKFTISNKTIGSYINKKSGSVTYMLNTVICDKKLERIINEITDK